MDVMEPLRFADWFSPLDVHQFRRDVLGRSSLVVPPRPELAEHVLKSLAIDSLDKIVALRGARVYAWFQKRDGRHASALIPAASARTFYEAGTTLYIRRIAEFEALEREVAKSLGIPRVAVESTLFCNPPEAVTRPHFDRADLIIIQLNGRKTWRIAPNTFAPNPLFRWATLDRVSPEIRLYADGVPPAGMPDGASSHELERGSVLHLPRGYWHQTMSGVDSFSLHIQIASPSRLDVLTAALKNELARDEWWREPAYDFSARDPSALEHAAVARLALRDAALRLDPRDIVRLPVPNRKIEPGARFERAGQASFAIDSLDSRQESARVTLTSYQFSETEMTHAEMSIEFVAACRWINGLTTGTAFDIPELLREVPGLDEEEATDLVGLLEGAHLVRRQ